ncbi:hypothetical protein KPH14_001873 [Odynerus spinipes]|uniref:Caspase activity and apoptosis inhibitor 1 n=1 Tax=Odynerus spinipes TaxID=1348599 RepID=A0AAD9S0K3_9HYME|nr:hypothetical protein KPH14_001873 [Odynerus spinipes]
MSKTKKNSHSSEEFSSTSYSSSSVSSDEEIDARDLKPIKDYLSNRRELARQLFKSVKSDKIRMMLPQVLKKMDLGELEEWCASELSGMSKTRILSILNGNPMLESSDTSESDESGPSLEIISDTEEWLTEDDNIKKEEGVSGKTKVKKHKSTSKVKSQSNNKKEDVGNAKLKAKGSTKDGGNDKYKDVKVKKEEEKETGKEKEADSLLDLLELEMRARAIRALIRKEDDIIPNSNESKTSTNNSTEENRITKSRQDELNAKENCRRQLEKIISSQQMDGDEDVVLVVQPTPTIELLSSESENEEGGTRINQKLENERKLEAEKNTTKLDNKTNVTSTKEQESKESQEITEGKDTNKKTSNTSEETSNSNASRNKSSSSLSPTSTVGNTTKRKKVKKKSHSKSEIRSESSSSTNNKVNECTEKTEEKITVSEEKGKTIENIPKEEKEPIPTVSDSKQKIISDEDKLADFEEIIDLDNYSDDMDDLENCDNDKSKHKDNQKIKNKDNIKEQKKSQVQQSTESNLTNSQKSKSSETWATRYYQTDDVQNVIKESKIQSEIRKRLRERQRLSKLNNSPNINSSSPSRVSELNIDKIEPKPTGSVEEYLALKQATQVNLNSDAGSTAANTPEKDKTIDTEDAIDDKSVTSINEESIQKSSVTIVNNDL